MILLAVYSTWFSQTEKMLFPKIGMLNRFHLMCHLNLLVGGTCPRAVSRRPGLCAASKDRLVMSDAALGVGSGGTWARIFLAWSMMFFLMP